MLNNLEILNGSITPVFDSNIKDYEVEVSDTTISLVMQYDTDENNKITIYGNDNLLNGENHVLIEVYDGNNVNTYTLTVYKGLKDVSTKINENVKIEVVGKEYNNTVIQCSIIIFTIIVIILLYRLIFKLHK